MSPQPERHFRLLAQHRHARLRWPAGRAAPPNL